MNIAKVAESTYRAAGEAAAGRPRTDTFLQLLVAQLRTQNPLEPQKGTEFITQLAQFNTLEQLIAIRAELSALRQEVEQSRQSGPGGRTQPGSNPN
jgi:flagellar basal-body rod modification protein FlgD